MRKLYLIGFVALSFATVSRAQDSTNFTTLKEVVISASRTEKPLIEIPRSVTVLDAEQIRSSVYQSVGELLNSQPGVFVIGVNQTPGTNQNIFMRGSNSNQVAVLIDGVRIADPSTPNTAIDLSEISLTNVERIEIIRGSHSTIFGGAAIGGVVNIITRRGATPGLHGDASWQGGMLAKKAWSSTETLNLRYGMKNGLYFAGSVFQQDVKGLNAAERSVTFPSFTSDRDDFRKSDASIKAGYKDDKWDANISYKRAHQYTEIDNGAFSDDDNNYLEFDRDLFQYSAQYNISSLLQLSLLGSLSKSERFYENDSSKINPNEFDKTFSTGTYYGRLQTHELQLTFRQNGVEVLFGGGVYREKMLFDNYFFYNDPTFPFEFITNYDSIDTRTSTGYVFARLGYDIGNFSLSGGARLSRHTTAGNFATFEFNPSYSIGDLLFYGSISTGFNAPSLYQLYDPSKGFNGYTTRGNPQLKPEQSVSLEAGIKKQFQSGSYVTFSAYHTNVSNAIEYVYLWNGDKDIASLDFSDDRGDTYLNVGDQRVKGIEAEGYLQVSPSLFFQGNLSLLQAQINASPADISADLTGGHHVQLYNLGRFLEKDFEQKEVVRRPGFTAFARLGYEPIAALTLSATYRYTGDRFDAGYDGTLGPYGGLARIDVDAYHLIDLGVNWKASKVISLGVKVENVLDEKYREVVGFQTRGRSAYLKVSAVF